ncbi:MAG: methionine--tRNA ligase [Clostridia bacterium]|nr:methionine--tRNA ligase [Clostridia bacterium]
MDKKTFYITTPIYYPSGKFHIGTAYTTTLADTIKRYKQMRGYDAYMLTGLDEHGQKIQDVAKKLERTPKEHVDLMAEDAKKLWKLMEIEYDDFIRTTDERHEKAVAKIVEKFLENEDIYLGKYEGWYCMPCETYFTETQLVDGKCPDCGREVKKMQEDSYFFNMKKYQERLVKHYDEHPDFVLPEFRKNEIFGNFIKPGLEDLCISRTTFDWGIKMPNDPKHVLYVWVDALTNYITALGYMSDDDSLFKKYWPANFQIVGKDIIRFHGIYWPIFLMALGLELPEHIYAHGYIVMKDGKMSKSKGNVIYPETLIEKYGLDATKYYLLREMTFGQDSMFTPEGFVERFNSDLCNDLGNLLNRTIGMVNKYFGGEFKADLSFESEIDNLFNEFVNEKVKVVESKMDEYRVYDAIPEIWNIISRSNKYIDETMPWALAKNGEKDKLSIVMYNLVNVLRKVAILIRPFMKNTSNNMFKQLNIDVETQNWDSLNDDSVLNNGIKVIEKGEPLFLRLDLEEEISYLQEAMRK